MSIQVVRKANITRTINETVEIIDDRHIKQTPDDEPRIIVKIDDSKVLDKQILPSKDGSTRRITIEIIANHRNILNDVEFVDVE